MVCIPLFKLLEDKIAPVTQELIDLNISNIKNLC